jgi:D-3-phosphoglycerate dehydrogenase
VKPTVFIPEKIAESGTVLLRTQCEIITDRLQDADAVIVRLFKITANQLAECKQLKVIAKHGVGVDNIDVAAATARRIPVVFTPAANANAVAEHTLTLLLALARNLYPASAALRAGQWTKTEGVELAGKTLGVIGLGRIGRRVAEIARDGLAMEVLAYDPFVSESKFPLAASLDALLRASDFLTLHLPLMPETNHLLNTDRLRLCKPTCRIVNTSRGAVIDEPALADTLKEGRIAGAALDVFEQEPLPAGHPFLATPNLLLTPHISSSTKESLDRMARDAAQGVLDVLGGKRPQWVVNPDVFR